MVTTVVPHHKRQPITEGCTSHASDHTSIWKNTCDATTNPSAIRPSMVSSRFGGWLIRANAAPVATPKAPKVNCPCSGRNFPTTNPPSSSSPINRKALHWISRYRGCKRWAKSVTDIRRL